MSKKEKDREGGDVQEQELKPEDFVREPATKRLKKKAEKWQISALVHGARKKECNCEDHQQE